MTGKERLIIIDGSSVIYRAFHAIPSTLSNSKGLPTNAIYGFIQTLRKIIKDFSPQYMAVAFDVKGPSFRHGKFAEYKVHRPPMPDLLSIQIPYIKRVLGAYNIAVLEKEGFEADDIIATIAKKAAPLGLRTFIITGDKDMYQLVGPDTVILDYLTGKEFCAHEVEEKFGVGPELIKDLLGLCGDSSDGVPGVPGVGPKTAAKLIKEYGGIAGIYENISKITAAKLRENLEKYRDQANLSRELVTLHEDVEVAWSLEGLRLTAPDAPGLMELLKELEFEKLLREVVATSGAQGSRAADFTTVTTEQGLKGALEAARKAKRVSMALFFTEEGVAGSLSGVAVAVSQISAYYLPVTAHPAGGGVREAAIGGFIRELLADTGVIKDTDNAKGLYIHAMKNGFELPTGTAGMDTSIASYLLDPSKPDHSVQRLAHEHLGQFLKETTAASGDEELAQLCCQKACYIYELSDILDKKLEESGLKRMYLEMELPLTEVLASMETTGVMVDRGILHALSKEIELQITALEGSIYASCGGEFNINSPKQLSAILFEKLKLKPTKRTKKGFSTDEEVLTELAKSHEIAGMILGYRGLAKLKSTYVDAILALINTATGRVHTSYNQTVTATGRLSSSRPNLQNIPVRGEMALRIREAFVAKPGHMLLCADYSQIELRIVAHMADDPVLIDSFLKGEDIHTRTACEIFGIMHPAMVTPEMRRRAKAINFGIIYGMGPYGLSTELGISLKEATEYIENYFAHYSAVKEFIDRTVKEAAQTGYTTTLFGRRRFVPELKSPVESVARLGARLAINTPIQGSSADIIKAAMINIYRRLRTGSLSSKMILQIHDELVFEVNDAETGEIKRAVKEEMEGVVNLKVPVTVKIKTGPNWRSVE